MTSELYEALEALCEMWNQYCSGSAGHVFMSAGEDTMEILEKYGLLKNTTICSGDVDWKRLEELKTEVV